MRKERGEGNTETAREAQQHTSDCFVLISFWIASCSACNHTQPLSMMPRLDDDDDAEAARQVEYRCNVDAKSQKYEQSEPQAAVEQFKFDLFLLNLEFFALEKLRRNSVGTFLSSNQ